MASSSLLSFLLAILFTLQQVLAQKSTTVFPSDFSLSWRNANSSAAVRTYMFPESYLIHMILLKRGTHKHYGNYLSFGLGFYCNKRLTRKCLLTICILENSANGTVRTDRSPEVVWMANRNHPVEENATLHADPRRGLVLIDANGTEVFHSKLSGNSVMRMVLTGNGDLLLRNSEGSIAWRSSDYPGNTILVGQRLRRGWMLTSSISNTNMKVSKFSLSVTSLSLTAFVGHKKSVAYLSLKPQGLLIQSSVLHHISFTATNITFVYKQQGRLVHLYSRTMQLSPIQLLRMDSDGGPRIKGWTAETGWHAVQYRLGGYDQCQLPMACGRYGLCTAGGCSCPGASDGMDHFTLLDDNAPNFGCRFQGLSSMHNTRLEQKYQLVNFGNLSYFSYFDPTAAVVGLTELGACVKACEGNSSCKAAFFSYDYNASDGYCYLPSKVLTIRASKLQGDLSNSVAYIKVPVLSVIPPLPPSTAQEDPSNSSSPLKILKASAIFGSIGASVLMTLCIVLCKVRRRKREVNDRYGQLLGGLTRFSYKELCSSTGKFSTRLGSGGFGTVFKGEQKDGTVVAVKKLNSVEQGMDEFLAEMTTLGSIHHYNLVKLIGFCADESNRLLVYEYMSNRSLDQWIFDDDRKPALNWETRRRIILDVARGLAYLHEECSQRIAHLDMKPHNILLDNNFSAKISDFGLARFIDRNQSHVSTGMRGTFGYLAPEWQHSRITVKADTYSFGIIIMEVLSGRPNLDYSQEDPEVHLLGILQRKANEDRLVDIVDKMIADWECNVEDIVLMIRIGAWCLNEDQTKRPRMSTIVKILEGVVEMEHDIEFKFANDLVLSCTPITNALQD